MRIWRISTTLAVVAALIAPVTAQGVRARPPAVLPEGTTIAPRPPEFRVRSVTDDATVWSLSGPLALDGFGPGVSLPGELPDGTYTLLAWTLDDAGRLSAPARSTFVLDSVPPAAPAVVTSPGERTTDAKPDFHWSGEPGATYTWYVTEQGKRVHEPRTTSTPRTEVKGLPSGKYRFEVFQTDAAGNRSEVGASPEFWLDRSGESRASARKLVRVRPRLLALPVGVMRPVAGAVLGHRRPLLRWKVPRRGVRPSFYNVQIFEGTRKVLSVFPKTNALRVPARVLRPGRRYYWQAWPYRGTRGYDKRPAVVGYFDLGSKRERSRQRLRAPARAGTLGGPDARWRPPVRRVAARVAARPGPRPAVPRPPEHRRHAAV